MTVAAETAGHDDDVGRRDVVERRHDLLRAARSGDDADGVADGEHTRAGDPRQHVPERPTLVGQHPLVGDDGDAHGAFSHIVVRSPV